MLVHNCYECHSGDAAKAKGHLLLDTAEGMRKGGDSGAVILPGHADSSLLVEAIRYEGLEMPPKGQLPDEVVEDFVQWIDIGRTRSAGRQGCQAEGQDRPGRKHKFWAFRPPKAVPPPEVKDCGAGRIRISIALCHRQEQEHLAAVRDADRLTLIRRVTFDLTGLPPTPADVDAFLKDTSAGTPRGRRPVARFSTVRRASAHQLVRRGSLCRVDRQGPQRPLSLRLAVSRLRHRRLQR